jgi:hypothetical protein
VAKGIASKDAAPVEVTSSSAQTAIAIDTSLSATSTEL